MSQRGTPTIALYLDDTRPCPVGWTLARDVREAKRLLASGRVLRASLDHDLGACPECLRKEAVRRDLDPASPEWGGVMPHCSHVWTGYDLCLWMAETNCWPAQRPEVHSMNRSVGTGCAA